MSKLAYRQQTLEDRWDAIVIGSGIGGLTAAALLAKHGGKRVLVLERHYEVGGYTHTFHRPGYEWDVGVHYIGQVRDSSSPVRAAFDHVTGGRLRWSPMPDVYDRVVLGGKVFDFVRGLEAFRDRLKRCFPGEERAIDGYLKSVRQCVRSMNLFFAEKAIPDPLARWIGGLLRAPSMRWASRTTAEVLHGLTSNAELAAVLTGQWGDYGLPPAQSSFAVHATIAEHYFDGGYYPVGGAGQIAETIAPEIEAAGGRVVVSAEVAGILLREGRAAGVRMADGREFRAPVVVSDAGAMNTFERLLPPGTAGVDGILKDIRALPAATSFLALYVGVKATARELGLDGTNLWIHPTADHDANMARFTVDPDAPFPLVFISFPSAKDPEFEQRHPGRATVEAVSPVPYDWFARWQDTHWKHRGADYDSFKAQLAERMQAEVERNVPALAGRVDYAELSTPLSTRHFTNYAHGEAYGLAATPARFRLRSLKPRTPVPGLYLAGQDVSLLGVTGALFGGALAASAVLGRNLVTVLTRPGK
jgi:all-trans-retinol 13,14-reductase